jgi:hypothetical protein
MRKRKDTMRRRAVGGIARPDEKSTPCSPSGGVFGIFDVFTLNRRSGAAIGAGNPTQSNRAGHCPPGCVSAMPPPDRRQGPTSEMNGCSS